MVGTKVKSSAEGARGFTLVEILCVVVILAIAAAIVVPQLSEANDLNAAAGARAIMADVLYAQNRAITTQQMQYVSFNVSGQSYGLYGSMTPPLTPLTHPVTRMPYVIGLGATGSGSLANCVLTSVSFGGQAILAFDESGAPYSYSTVSGTATSLSGQGTIVIASGTYSLTINVNQDTGDLSCD